MKVIDILNKMANEELKDGFKFKYMGFTYIYKKWEDRIAKADEDFIGFTDDWYIEEALNDEVEVIEENKEIEELNKISYDEFKYAGDKRRFDLTNIEYDKINELVRAVNKLNKEREEK